jgi:methyl coenzyme M reductase gamma subunit
MNTTVRTKGEKFVECSDVSSAELMQRILEKSNVGRGDNVSYRDAQEALQMLDVLIMRRLEAHFTRQ